MRLGKVLVVAVIGALALVALPATAHAIKCGGKKAKIVGGGGNNKIVIPNNGHGSQVVYAGAGNDTIITGKGGDIVCGGPGNDTIRAGKGKDKAFGGADNDTIVNDKGKDSSFGEDGNDNLLGGPSKESMDGGPGNDIVNGSSDRDDLHGGTGDDMMFGDDGSDNMFGDDGNDAMHGGGGGEEMQGNAGNDRLYGELLDDQLDGGGGNDLIVGGHGIDNMLGNSGDDWLRGGTNRDQYVGGGGGDTASFGSAIPNDGSAMGVIASLSAGVAQGPGGQDGLNGIENLLGSAFDDELIGDAASNSIDGGPGDDQITGGGAGDPLEGGPGDDLCDVDPNDAVTSCGVGTTEAPPDPRPAAAYAFMDARGPDPGLYVVGQGGGAAPAADDITITATGGAFNVTSASGTPIVPLMSASSPYNTCQPFGNGATCPAPPVALSFITFSGGSGADALKVTGNFPSGMTSDIDGGPDSDQLQGGPEDDVMFSGATGADSFKGGDGSDALIAEGTGGDTMDAGAGNDQLVTDDVCQGHNYIGGTGFDIAGFGRYALAFNGKNGVKATLGGSATDPARGGCVATQIGKDNEILEGSSGPDELHGDNGKNPLIIGREGDDVIHGEGGADTLSGDAGNDSLFGDGGFDTLEAQDGARDKVINCGKGGGQALKDKNDPKAQGCGKQKKGKNKRKK